MNDYSTILPYNEKKESIVDRYAEGYRQGYRDGRIDAKNEMKYVHGYIDKDGNIHYIPGGQNDNR